MGGVFSLLNRPPNEVGQNETNSGNGVGGFRYPPKNGGNYFGSHFVMGGERFESSEQYLFGENMDLNFLTNKPIPFPYPAPQSTEPTKTLKALVNIRKESLRLVKIPSANAEPENIGYNIEFVFDADARCEITIMYFCREEVSQTHGLIYRPRDPKMNSEPVKYKAGPNQTFTQTEHIFTPGAFPEGDLTYDFSKEIFPVVIQCVVLEGDDPKQSHATAATVEKHSEATYTLKPLKQKLFVDGLAYLLQEIYGIENKNSGIPNPTNVKPLPVPKGLDDNKEDKEDDFEEDSDDENSSSECVICMSDVRDTLILPCRHLCLCYSCGDSLRYQASACPICRIPFRALLQIRAVYRVPAVAPVEYPTLPPTHLPVLQMNTIIPGYEMVPLLEALNGANAMYQPSEVHMNAAAAALARQEAVRNLTGDTNERSERRRGSDKERELKVMDPTKVLVAPSSDKVEEGDELEHVGSVSRMKTTTLNSTPSPLPKKKEHVAIKMGQSSSSKSHHYSSRSVRNKLRATGANSSSLETALRFSSALQREFDPTVSPVSPTSTSEEDYCEEGGEGRRGRRRRAGKKLAKKESFGRSLSGETGSDPEEIPAAAAIAPSGGNPVSIALIDEFSDGELPEQIKENVKDGSVKRLHRMATEEDYDFLDEENVQTSSQSTPAHSSVPPTSAPLFTKTNIHSLPTTPNSNKMLLAGNPSTRSSGDSFTSGSSTKQLLPHPPYTPPTPNPNV